MLEMAKQFEMNPNRRLLQGKVVATLFFEPSTRTLMIVSLSVSPFEELVAFGSVNPMTRAPRRLAAVSKMVSSYADIIVMRHYLEGAARYASEVAPVPIVNAGDEVECRIEVTHSHQ